MLGGAWVGFVWYLPPILRGVKIPPGACLMAIVVGALLGAVIGLVLALLQRL